MSTEKINAPLVIPQITDRASLTASVMSANLEYSGGSWMHKPEPRAEFVSAAAWQEILRLRACLSVIASSTTRSASHIRKFALQGLENNFPEVLL